MLSQQDDTPLCWVPAFLGVEIQCDVLAAGGLKPPNQGQDQGTVSMAFALGTNYKGPGWAKRTVIEVIFLSHI